MNTSTSGGTTPISISGNAGGWAERHEMTPRSLNEAAPPGTVPKILWWNPAWYSVAAAVGLTAIGLAAIRLTDDPADPYYTVRQGVFLMLGLIAAAGLAIPHPRWWRNLSYPACIAVVLMLAFVLAPLVPTWLVRPRKGARRWINLIFIDFQPSELAKIVFVMALAYYLQARKNYRTLRGLLVPFVIMFVPMGLILVEPDLGTSLLFPAVLFAMLLAAGARLSHMFTIAGLGLASAVLVAVVSLWAAGGNPARYPLLEKHQVERIQGLVNQVTGNRQYEDTINYQSFKAMTLVGAGGFAGLGAERSRVIVEYNKLPEDHNDMIFAVIVNRWGFLGGSILVAMYLVYCLGLVATAAVTKDSFGRLVCVGFAAAIAAQMIVNIGMTIGLLPITGMTLPFVSYGGSSLIANYMMVGIAMGVALRPPKFLAGHSFEFDERREGRDPLDRLR